VIVIVTDLDGTLLHPDTYSFREAIPAVQLIRKRGIPLVLCSSKTRAELEVWRERLDNDHPFIVENGGGIFIPSGYFPFRVEGESEGRYARIAIGSPYDVLRKEFVRLRSMTGTEVRGFGDMTVDEVAALTGLSKPDAGRAKEREYDEPFVFMGKDRSEQEFLRAVENANFIWTKGLLYHITGNNDKGRAVSILLELFAALGEPVRTIGLGDSLNDMSFLRMVDQPVLIPRKDGTYEQGVDLPGLVRAQGVGPEGWNDAIMKLLAA
jgi:mannosyl-3-phosphoglycerate phosphatase family protein